MASETITSDLYREEYQPSFVDKWDELIDWEGRAEGEGDFYPNLLRQAGATRILDAACGTGYHSVTLRKAGFDVVAADGAEEMLSKTQENARRLGVELELQHADWRTLSEDISERFDALLCLGNAYTHLFSEDERVQAMAQFHKILKPGGIAIIDQRNYDSILDEGFSSKHQYYYTGEGVDARPEEITEEYVKFRYTFPDGAVHHLTMCPIRQRHLTRLMTDAGFRDVRRFGDFKAEFEPLEPDFVVQVATA
jgi:SAM-dependent methyltransferase